MGSKSRRIKNEVAPLSFFQSSGPLLPIPLDRHSMVRLGKGQAILGGSSNEVYDNSKIYSMTCSNRDCTISLLTRELSVPRGIFVAISIPDTFSGCITKGKSDFKKKPKVLCKQIHLFPLQYRLPVPRADWGWFLS